jgi:hypothetical protein
MKRTVVLLSLISLVMCAGCSKAIVPTAFEIQEPPSASKIPLRAALYLSPQFKKKAIVANKGGMDTILVIGDAMANGAERSLRGVFQKLVIVDNINPDIAGQGIAAIVTPEMVDSENRQVGFPPKAKWDSRIVCKWTISRPDGKLLYMNTITGEGHYEAFTTAFSFGEHLGKSIIPAVQNHYKNLTTNLLTAQWWQDSQ